MDLVSLVHLKSLSYPYTLRHVTRIVQTNFTLEYLGVIYEFVHPMNPKYICYIPQQFRFSCDDRVGKASVLGLIFKQMELIRYYY